MKIAIVHSYYHQPTNACSFRARFLKEKLESDYGNEVTVYAENSGRPNTRSSFFTWMLKTIVRLIFHRWDIMYLTSPPGFTLFLTAVKFLKPKGFIICDIRDPLSFNIGTDYSDQPLKKNSLKYYGAVALEKVAYHFSDAFVVCTDGMFRYYEKLFGTSSKILVVENGADLSLKDGIQRGKNIHAFRFICAGRWWTYSPKSAKMVVQFINVLAHKLDRPVELILLGHIEQDAMDFLNSHAANIMVRYGGLLNYDQVITEISNSDIGIAIIQNTETDYGSKLFDYLALHRAVLTVASPASNFSLRFSNVPYFFALDPTGKNWDDLQEQVLTWLLNPNHAFPTIIPDPKYLRSVTMEPLLNLISTFRN